MYHENRAEQTAADAITPDGHVNTDLLPARNWLKAIAPYKTPSLNRSLIELAITIIPFIALWALAVWTSSISYFLTVPVCVLAGFFLVRLFLIQHDCSHGAFFKSRAANDWVKYWISTMGTNLAMAAIIIGGIYWLGWLPFLVTYLCITCIAAAIGVWLFYVQHQFEDVMWDTDENWQVHDAALYGSTHYDLPPVLRWLTANIGIHHVHHLYARIPYYNLSKILKAHPKLGEIRRLTLLESFKTVRLKLWDAKERKLVTYRDAKLARAKA